MDVKKSLITALSLVAVAVLADPAPVADLSRSSNKSYAAQSSSRSGSVEERLSALERVVEARAAAQLQMQQQLQTLLDEVSELSGKTEMHSYKLEEILQQQRDIYQEIDRRMGGQGGAATQVQSSANVPAQTPANVPAGNPAAVVAADQVATADVAAAPAAVTMTEAQAYEQAINYVIKDNNYAAAIPAFESFIRDYPNSDYTSNSHYWLGQLYYQKNELGKAKNHFERVVTQYPNTTRVPDALLKLGMVAEKQNESAAAKKYYNQLVKSFPKSKPAATARKKLETM
ncbi:MAG TPA: tol-pal system protein YbgF [Rheinheimera sp.]|uniref:tol-pal system protein YbgF n=1 Tax=Rheinheimera sp. TaxID=1869214 RepID=UPI000EEB2826|nr:tol-pal system protein YbgF [Rheinheimera sp.]HCU66361.1 tol-pal system protein YbgF [Rheinheimera sp.]